MAHNGGKIGVGIGFSSGSGGVTLNMLNQMYSVGTRNSTASFDYSPYMDEYGVPIDDLFTDTADVEWVNGQCSGTDQYPGHLQH